MTLQQTEKQPLTLALPRLPDLKAVGGNARHRYWKMGWIDFQVEKRTWYVYIKAYLDEQGMKAPYPHFQKAKADVTLYFRDRRRRDGENCQMALKALWDALRDPKGKERFGLGILADDDAESLQVTLIVAVDKARAPLTVIEIREV